MSTVVDTPVIRRLVAWLAVLEDVDFASLATSVITFLLCNMLLHLLHPWRRRREAGTLPQQISEALRCLQPCCPHTLQWPSLWALRPSA